MLSCTNAKHCIGCAIGKKSLTTAFHLILNRESVVVCPSGNCRLVVLLQLLVGSNQLARYTFPLRSISLLLGWFARTLASCLHYWCIFKWTLVKWLHFYRQFTDISLYCMLSHYYALSYWIRCVPALAFRSIVRTTSILVYSLSCCDCNLFCFKASFLIVFPYLLREKCVDCFLF